MNLILMKSLTLMCCFILLINVVTFAQSEEKPTAIAVEVVKQKGIEKVQELADKLDAGLIKVKTIDTTQNIYVIVANNPDSTVQNHISEIKEHAERKNSGLNTIEVNEMESGGITVESKEYIVRFKKSMSESQLEEVIGRRDVTSVVRSRSDKFQMMISFKSEKAMQKFSETNVSLIEYMVVNEYSILTNGVRTAVESPHPTLSILTGLNDSLISRQWYFAPLNVFRGETPLAYWTQARGDSVVVAIIDDGVDIFHEDLRGKIEKPYDYFGRNYSFDKFDEHGTACAGIIGAMVNNVGIAGIAQDSRIMPIKVFYHHDGVPQTASWILAEAITVAVDSGAQVINCSWRADIQKANRAPIDFAIDYAISKNRLLVFAAGNDGTDTLAYPAIASRDKSVISVGALDKNNQLRAVSGGWGSQYGKGLTLCAPGEDIFSTKTTIIDGMKYDYVQGTSFAAPMVAATAALMLSVNGKLTPEELKKMLVESADTLRDTRLNREFRTLNIWKAVDKARESTTLNETH